MWKIAASFELPLLSNLISLNVIYVTWSSTFLFRFLSRRSSTGLAMLLDFSSVFLTVTQIVEALHFSVWEQVCLTHHSDVVSFKRRLSWFAQVLTLFEMHDLHLHCQFSSLKQKMRS